MHDYFMKSEGACSHALVNRVTSRMFALKMSINAHSFLAGRMQLRQLRQLCAHLFRLPEPPGMLAVKSPSGAIPPCEAAEDSVLGDLDLQVCCEAPLH